MRKLLWASAHMPTEEQLQDLKDDQIIFLKDSWKELQENLNNTPADTEELNCLAVFIVNHCMSNGIRFILQPGGSPAYQYVLGQVIESMKNAFRYDTEKVVKIPDVMYAHSERNSRDELQKDGTIKKVSYFKHLGWIVV